MSFNHVIYVPEKSESTPLPVSEVQDQEVTEDPQDKYLELLWQEKERCIEEQKLYLRSLKHCENQFKKSLAMVRSINLKLDNQATQALSDAKELITNITEKLNSTSSYGRGKRGR